MLTPTKRVKVMCIMEYCSLRYFTIKWVVFWWSRKHLQYLRHYHTQILLSIVSRCSWQSEKKFWYIHTIIGLRRRPKSFDIWAKPFTWRSTVALHQTFNVIVPIICDITYKTCISDRKIQWRSWWKHLS